MMNRRTGHVSPPSSTSPRWDYIFSDTAKINTIFFTPRKPILNLKIILKAGLPSIQPVFTKDVPPSKWPAWPLHVAVPLAVRRRHNQPEARSVGPSRPFALWTCWLGLVFVDDPWDWGIVLKPTCPHQNQQIHVEQYTNCMTFYGKKCNVSTINTGWSCLAPNLAISCDELKPKYWEPCDPKLPELRMHGNKLSSLKLTASLPLKMDGWKINFLLGRPMLKGYASFREGRPLKSPCQEIWPIEGGCDQVPTAILQFLGEKPNQERQTPAGTSWLGFSCYPLRLEWYQTLLWNACMPLAQ